MPIDKPHDEVLFQPNQLPIGNVVNISTIHYNNQVYKYPKPIITAVLRNKLIYKISQAVVNNKWNVVIHG